MIPLHLGHLPWYGQVAVLVLAIGPFVVLGVAIWIRARQDAAAAEERRTSADAEPSEPPGDLSD